MFNGTSRRLNLITTQLQEGVMTTRMQPIGVVWNKLPRVVRDLAISCGKQIALEMEGAETELDKSIIEAIKDPLTHIVRNCGDHGIEGPRRGSRRGNRPRAGCCPGRFTRVERSTSKLALQSDQMWSLDRAIEFTEVGSSPPRDAGAGS